MAQGAMVQKHGAVSNDAIHTSSGPKPPRWKIAWRRGAGRRAIEPRRRGGGRRAKGSICEKKFKPGSFCVKLREKDHFCRFLLHRVSLELDLVSWGRGAMCLLCLLPLRRLETQE
jgi:hypothetical protein